MVEEVKVPAIYGLISKISKEAGALAPTSSTGVPFPFRGVDGTVNHLAPLLQKYGIITVPNVVSVIVTPREAGSRVVKTTEVITEFSFIAAEDGSSVTARTAGLADDFSDRSTAQASSVAFRIALLQTFTLPTQTNEEQNSQEVMEQGVKARQEAVKAPTKKEQDVEDVRADITAILEDNNNSFDGEKLNALGDELTGKIKNGVFTPGNPNVWGKDVVSLREILKELKERVAKEHETGEIKD